MSEQTSLRPLGIIESLRQSLIIMTAIGGSMTLAVAISHGVEYAFGLVSAALIW
ncbi:MAG: hypothetical protein HQL84_15810 [Magnetococcales bacterium]|nr:hypothetical protein [Magnetococcales bacterium]MBF0151487.1 hypothetical protein [Magnetococcales bacterium]MBF0175090.1 hypothetical protein [Magnetococcales bacterium]MBF0348944.1 hypothetical protein [Magnetococcales bacterium]MBF0632453.1 hypothetical protein [Magnetococcales bacterium]